MELFIPFQTFYLRFEVFLLCQPVSKGILMFELFLLILRNVKGAIYPSYDVFSALLTCALPAILILSAFFAGTHGLHLTVNMGRELGNPSC